MASVKLGSKSDCFLLDGHTWFCSTGLPSDIIIEVREFTFRLHKFPLLSRSGTLEKLIEEVTVEDGKSSILTLHEIPGGAETFLLVAKFYYGVKIEINALNVVRLRCAAEYLLMNEDYGDGNLILQTECFLDEVFGNWSDSFNALVSCQEILQYAEELHIVSRCINSLANKACLDPTLLSWPVSATGAGESNLWNGIQTLSNPQPVGDDWWYEDVSSLNFPFYKRLILAMESKGMKPERITGSLMFYTKKHLPMTGRESGSQNGSVSSSGSSVTDKSNAPGLDIDQRNLLEQIVELLPIQKGIAPTKFLLRLLRTSMILHASPSCRENLEKQVGSQLDQASLDDLMIPNIGYSAETLYDIDCVQRILDHFLLLENDANECRSVSLEDKRRLERENDALMPTTMVANLVDSYLAEIAGDVNLKLPKFLSVAGAVPDYARPINDGIYRAIDVYLKAHPWLTDSEREQLCRLLNCQKLSLEASTHAAQNERLPLRVIVQVLFFEQVRLRTSIAGWFFVSDNFNQSQNPLSGNLAAISRNDCSTQFGGYTQDQIVIVDDMKDRVSELEKECLNMKQDLQNLVKNKRSWNLILKKLSLMLKPRSADPKAGSMPPFAPKTTPPPPPPVKKVSLGGK